MSSIIRPSVRSINMSKYSAHSPLLTVVVPVYKTEHYLDECIESIVGQTLSNIEIILVDDGSPDRCPKICDCWADKDPRIRVVHKENQGLGFARNNGIELARGRYIAFVDSDDNIERETYATAIDMLESHNADLVRFSFNRFIDDVTRGSESYAAQPEMFDSDEEIRKLALCLFDAPCGLERFGIGGSACTAIYKLDLIRRYQIRFISERKLISEDYIFNFNYYRHCSRIVRLNRTYYHYRINPDSLTRNFNGGVMHRVENYCRYVEGMLTDAGFNEEAAVFAAGYYVSTFRCFLHQAFLSSNLSKKEQRQWFLERTSDSFFQRVCQIYSFNNLPFKQRVLFAAMARKLYCLSWFLIVCFSRLRRDKLK